MADPKSPFSSPEDEREQMARVQRVEREQLAFTNILRLKGEIKRASKEEAEFAKAISKLQGDQAKNAQQYQDKLKTIETLEKNIQEAKTRGNNKVAKEGKKLLDEQQLRLKQLAKTEGGALAARRSSTQASLKSLNAERTLLKSINEERAKTNKLGTVGVKIADLFRSKTAQQRQIDIARALS